MTKLQSYKEACSELDTKQRELADELELKAIDYDLWIIRIDNGNSFITIAPDDEPSFTIGFHEYLGFANKHKKITLSMIEKEKFIIFDI